VQQETKPIFKMLSIIQFNGLIFRKLLPCLASNSSVLFQLLYIYSFHTHSVKTIKQTTDIRAAKYASKIYKQSDVSKFILTLIRVLSCLIREMKERLNKSGRGKCFWNRLNSNRPSRCLIRMNICQLKNVVTRYLNERRVKHEIVL
jgi:hypothetical protein